MVAILMQESRYSLSRVSSSKDYGISQINFLNLERFHLSKVRLLTDLDYSVEAGAKILSNYKTFQKREPVTWWSRYNCGNNKFEVIKDTCLTYKSKVDRYL